MRSRRTVADYTDGSSSATTGTRTNGINAPHAPVPPILPGPASLRWDWRSEVEQQGSITQGARMKLIEAMKKIKELSMKAADLQAKVGTHCANLDIETPMYPDPSGQVKEWIQAHGDILKEVLDRKSTRLNSS